ncbi:uncharacterized protein LOC135205977 isoform X2 [Macrobrachium nipponense]|uniref:uncharacterized protein LOC135205977 isoform X2 n=1 Tax=Macrobrachium nipponense TaxID=159736 RepID=UPI0030C80AC4
MEVTPVFGYFCFFASFASITKGLTQSRYITRLLHVAENENFTEMTPFFGKEESQVEYWKIAHNGHTQSEVQENYENNQLGPMKRRNTDKCDERYEEKLFVKIVLTFADQPLVIVHDGEQKSFDIINLLQDIKIQISLILVDFKHLANDSIEWPKQLQNDLYIYILILSEQEASVLNLLGHSFLQSSHPKYLLLLDVSSGGFGRHLLNHKTLNKIPFLSLIRPQYDSCIQTPMISLETYNIFSKNVSNQLRQSYEFSYDLNKRQVFPDRFPTFLGYHFHLASWQDDFPYMVKKEGGSETSGICFIMLREISRKLNFTFQVYDLPPDNQWGSYVNGSWRGMIGEVYYGQNQMTWIVLAITSLVIVGIYILFFKILGIHRARDFVWIALDVFKTILGLDSESFSYYSSVTLFIGIWRLAAMVISVSYRGNLVAYISVPPAPLRLKTLDQLASSSSLTPLMTDYGSYLPVALKNSGDTTLRTLGERLEIIPFDNRLAFDKVYEGRYAFLEESSFLHSLVVSYNVSNVYYLPETLNQVHLGWYFPKNTPWKYKFDHFLSIFAESGLTYYWYKEVKDSYEKENNYTNTNIQDIGSLQPLSMTDLQGVFVVYGFGISMSLLAAAAEIVTSINGLQLSHKLEKTIEGFWT